MTTQEHPAARRFLMLGIRRFTALAVALVALSLTAAAPKSLAPGAVVGLAGTPHLWIADSAGVLHWGGDTRALAGKHVNWSDRRDVSLAELQAFPIGDPWLSAGLLKDGDPIYLVKWETEWPQPQLLHIQSIKDVELFGIDGSNYGNFVLDKATWEARYHLDADRLQRSALAAVVAAVVVVATPTAVVVATPTATVAPTAAPPSTTSASCAAAAGGVAVQTIELGRVLDDGRASWESQFESAIGPIDPRLIKHGAVAYLARFIFASEINAHEIPLHIELTSSRTDGGILKGPQFTDDFEARGVFTLTSGDNCLAITGIPDAEEPYVWTPSNTAEVRAFVTAVLAMPLAARTGRLTLSLPTTP